MSADNYMAIKKIDNVWHVWMVLGGYDRKDWTIPSGAYHKIFDDEIDAHHYAHKVCSEEIVEYGVILLEPKETKKDIVTIGDHFQLVGKFKGLSKASSELLSMFIKEINILTPEKLRAIRRIRSILEGN